jgi:hypothetical protein
MIARARSGPGYESCSSGLVTSSTTDGFHVASSLHVAGRPIAAIKVGISLGRSDTVFRSANFTSLVIVCEAAVVGTLLGNVSSSSVIVLESDSATSALACGATPVRQK